MKNRQSAHTIKLRRITLTRPRRAHKKPEIKAPTTLPREKALIKSPVAAVESKSESRIAGMRVRIIKLHEKIQK